MSVRKPTDRRLIAAARFVRPMAVFADIGTDHAYLPVFLVENGRVNKAYATDINRGPVERAEANISAVGLSGVIETRLCNGLDGLNNCGITDIAICGMGGELIAKIVENAPWTQDSSLRLILQPMTKPEKLREFLLSTGFGIVSEALAFEDRIYQLICAEYGKETEKYTPLELLIGKENLVADKALYRELALHTKAVMEKRIAGKALSDCNTAYEDSLVAEIEKVTKSPKSDDFGQE